MKKLKLIIITSLMMFVTVFVYSQTVSGIGFLKLGTPTTDIFKNIPGEVKICKTQSETYKFKNDVIELVSDTTLQEKPIYGTYASKTRVFSIPKIKLNEEIEIKNVYLIFHNDTLVKVSIDYNSSVNEALTLKYGVPKDSLVETPHDYTMKSTGSKVRLTDQRLTSSWDSKNIKCYSLIWKYYTGSIDPNIISYFTLYYSDVMEKIQKEDKLMEDLIKKRKEDAKKKSLNDF